MASWEGGWLNTCKCNPFLTCCVSHDKFLWFQLLLTLSWIWSLRLGSRWRSRRRWEDGRRKGKWIRKKKKIIAWEEAQTNNFFFLQQIGQEVGRRWWQGQAAAARGWQVRWVILASSQSHFLAFFFVSGLQGTEPEEEEGKKCALTNGWASGLSLLE